MNKRSFLMLVSRLFFLICCFITITIFVGSCNDQRKSHITDRTSIDPKDSLILIPSGDVTVACYYFPNWGPLNTSEWRTVKFAQPKFSGHQQPKVPLWGYQNEQDPVVMAKKIENASNNGIDVFLFDWYYYDNGPYLHEALDSGYLRAKNKSDLKFAIIWCNHDVGEFMKGAVKKDTFYKIIDDIISKYFKDPSYWKINGCPFFSIYQTTTFLQIFNNDTTQAYSAIQYFRQKVKEAGFPDLHLDASLWDLKASGRNTLINRMGVNSTSSYTWIHHVLLKDFPTTKYTLAADTYFNYVTNGGGYNGLESPAYTIPVPYYINVSMGWDSSPRCGNITEAEWLSRREPYPFGPVLINNTPHQFKKYLAKAKSLTLKMPENHRIIMINAWNEWGEGSYLEPDTINGMEYLYAIKEVFEKY